MQVRDREQFKYLQKIFSQDGKNEYLLNLQMRHKWNKEVRDMQCGDIALMTDEDTYRGQWNRAGLS